MAGDRLLPEPLACAGPGTVECCKSTAVFATCEALSLSQPSSTSPPTALVPGVGPATLPGNASLGDLPISGCLSSRLWVDTAYYLVHAMAGGEEGFEIRDLYAAQNFGRAAQAAGVRRIIYVGGLGRDEDTLSPHLRSRHEVGEQLRSWGVLVT